MMSITSEQIAQAKGRGFLRNRGTDNFSARVVTSGGVYTAAQLRAVSECAEKYGCGKVVFTSRLSAEITGIPFENLAPVEAFIAQNGLEVGGTGPKVRPITACKGTTCTFGNIDTQELAHTLHTRFYQGMHDVKLPHKFKIGVGGCPNSCMKPSLNDIGIEGYRVYEFDAAKCRGCAACAVAAACPSHAVHAENGRAVIDKAVCMDCGVCVGKCPFGAVPETAQALCRVYVGGTWGRTQRVGTPLDKMIPVGDVPDFVGKAIDWYRENGLPKERFAKTLERVGMDAFLRAMEA